MSSANDAATLISLLVHVGLGAAGAVVARRKNRSALLWFIVCFIFVLFGLLFLAFMPKRAPRGGPAIALAANDAEKWAMLLASDAEVADAAAKLRSYGERYEAGFASALLSRADGSDRRSIIENALARARADAGIVAEGEAAQEDENKVNSVFRTSRGMVAQFRDGRALAQTAAQFTLFDSLESYRRFYADDDAWWEITKPEEKRAFLAAAGVHLNGDAEPRKPLPEPPLPDVFEPDLGRLEQAIATTQFVRCPSGRIYDSAVRAECPCPNCEADRTASARRLQPLPLQEARPGSSPA
jgi:hypothetical protein